MRINWLVVNYRGLVVSEHALYAMACLSVFVRGDHNFYIIRA